MKKYIRAAILLLLGIFAIVLSNTPVHAAPPPNFQTTAIVTSGLNGPSAFGFAPDGRIFILERLGAIKIVKGGVLLPTPFITLPSVGTGDRGLIGIAFDPDWNNNKYVYFYYTGEDLLNRLVRVNAQEDVANEPPAILYQTTFLSEQLHVGGSIAFGPDGKLYFAVGDNGYPPNAQNLANPHGKLLRINKDGTVPADNPFVGVPGALPEIWAYGMRNPWRFQFDTATGRLYDGDVGNNTWEEINLIVKGGNYGWPICEGFCANNEYIQPEYAYNHDGASSAVTMGPVYHSALYPQQYQGKLFFGDYARGFIKTATLDGNGHITGVTDFDNNAGSVVDLKVALDGSIYYINYYPGRLYRIGYSTTNLAPAANASADVTKGVNPLTVHFRSDGSSDPNSDPLTFHWDFGDGTTSNEAHPVKTYTQNGAFVAQLTVSDGVFSTQAVPLSIQIGIPPTLIVNVPHDNSTYKAGEEITYNASATDGVGNDLNDNNISTEITFHHLTHIHPFMGPVLGRTGTFVTPISGEESPDTWFEIKVVATDTNGLSATKTINIYPEKSNITLASSPAGIPVLIDGQPTSTPATLQQVVNFHREINVNSPQMINGVLYRFDHWSDNGTQKHTIAVPQIDTTYTAVFTPSTSTQFVGEYFPNQNLTGNAVITREDPAINFNWGEGTPDPLIFPDHFSARWTKKDTFAAGNYLFHTVADDGIRVFIDGVKVFDRWIDQSSVPHDFTVAMTGGEHTVVVEYYENGGGATAQVNWGPTDLNPDPTPPPTTPPSTDGFAAQYYNNQGLTGAPVLTRTDSVVNFDWGEGSPAPVVAQDHFSARWTKSIDLTAGTWSFSVTADDGVRLFVDGEQLINQWVDQSPHTYVAQKSLTAGAHTIIMEYFENGGGAVAKLSYEKIAGVPSTPPPTITGFKGEYFANQTLTGTPILTRDDATVNFNWGEGSPDSSLPVDHFSARFTKAVNFTAGVYKFSVTGDDGVRLKIDETTVIDKWVDQSSKTYEVELTLTEGIHNVVFEYYENGGDAVAKLSWTQTGTTLPPTTDFIAEYWNNMTLAGAPVATTTAPSINFDWGEGSPIAPIGVDNFSARFTKTSTFAAGSYTFSVTGDDGFRLKLDGTTIIDKWIDQSPHTYDVTVNVTGGTHTIILEYYENGGGAVVKYSSSLLVPQVPTSFTAQYFSNQLLSGSPILTRVENAINNDWGEGSPDISVPADHFSARWTGTFNFLAPSAVFHVRADDGFRLKIDGNTVFDKWVDQSPTNYDITVPMTSGDHVLTFEYFENGGGAVAQLSW